MTKIYNKEDVEVIAGSQLPLNENPKGKYYLAYEDESALRTIRIPYNNLGILEVDEEDVTVNVKDKIEFKNKAFNANLFSGLGRVFLRKSIVNRLNILDQSLISLPNTIYKVQYDHDLNGKTIEIPANCTLEFDGGSLYNGAIVFDNTLISGNPLIKCSVSGTLLNEFVNIDWFGAKKNNSDFQDNNIAFTRAIESGCKNVRIDGDYYWGKGIGVTGVNNLNIKFSGGTMFINNPDVYRLLTFTKCQNLYIEGLIADFENNSVSVLGIIESQDTFINLCHFKKIGNSSKENVRALSFDGDCSRFIVKGCSFVNIQSSANSTGISVSVSSTNTFSQFFKIESCHFEDIIPEADSDGIKVLQIANDSYSTIDNCTFKNCSKRAVKLQGRFHTVTSCKSIGFSSFAHFDAQSGHTIFSNLTINHYKDGKTPTGAFIRLGGYNNTISNCAMQSDVTDATLLKHWNVGIYIDKTDKRSTLTAGYLKIDNVSILNQGVILRVDTLQNLDLSITNSRFENISYSYGMIVDSDNALLSSLVLTNLMCNNAYTSALVSNITGINGSVLIRDIISNLKPVEEARRGNNKSYIERFYPLGQYIKSIIDNKGKRIILANRAPNNSDIVYSYSAIGDEVINNDATSDIEKWICIGKESGSIGVWKACYRYTKEIQQ